MKPIVFYRARTVLYLVCCEASVTVERVNRSTSWYLGFTVVTPAAGVDYPRCPMDLRMADWYNVATQRAVARAIMSTSSRIPRTHTSCLHIFVCPDVDHPASPRCGFSYHNAKLSRNSCGISVETRGQGTFFLVASVSALPFPPRLQSLRGATRRRQVSVYMEDESPVSAPFLNDILGWRSSGIRVVQSFTHKTPDVSSNLEVRRLLYLRIFLCPPSILCVDKCIRTQNAVKHIPPSLTGRPSGSAGNSDVPRDGRRQGRVFESGSRHVIFFF